MRYVTTTQSLNVKNSMFIRNAQWIFFIYLGIGSEICARIMEHESFFHLDAPIIRVTGTYNHLQTTFSSSSIYSWITLIYFNKFVFSYLIRC